MWWAPLRGSRRNIPESSVRRGEEGKGGSRDGICYSYEYDSDWELVPQPEHLLPDVVVTSKGTRQREGKSEEIESFHELLTFSFSADEYALSSRKDLRQSQE